MKIMARRLPVAFALPVLLLLELAAWAQPLPETGVPTAAGLASTRVRGGRGMDSSIPGQLAYAAVHTSYDPDVTSSATITDPITNTVFEVLHAFAGGTDGANSSASLIQLDDGTLYGPTVYGGGGFRCGPVGDSGCGTLFKMAPDGTAYSVFYAFPSLSGGANPMAALIRASDGNLYGTTYNGGTPGIFTECGLYGEDGCGTAFRIAPDGTGYTDLHHFSRRAGDGTNPRGALIQATDGFLYGTTTSGPGPALGSGYGAIFRMSLDGSDYTLVHRFTGTDGAYPAAGIIQGQDGYLYGTTNSGGGGGTECGRYGCGTVFRIAPDGTGHTVLHAFTGGTDGALPAAALSVGWDGYLYGTTSFGGGSSGCNVFLLSGCGTIFKVAPDGTDYTIVYAFTGGVDGARPAAQVLPASDQYLYGTSTSGGASGCFGSGCGTVFRVTADGTLAVLHTFSGGKKGGYPASGLLLGQDGKFYGTTYIGGLGDPGLGIVFRLTLPEPER